VTLELGTHNVPLSAIRLAAIRDFVARDTASPQARALRDLLAEVDRLRAAPTLYTPPRQLPPASCPLRRSEIPILVGMARGETVYHTARRLGLTSGTVRQHRHRINKVVGSVNTANAVAVAFARGWLTQSDLHPEGDH
jgi:DNA-binding NarL/FixJ family response regulator